MADSFDVKVHIPEGLDHGAIVLSDEISAALRSSGLSLERAAKSLAPRSTGNLKRSIHSQVAPIGGNPSALVIAQAKYAAAVEYGSKPHTPPMGPIKRWVNRKLQIDGPDGDAVAGAIWMTIRRKGTQKHPFMVPAYKLKKESIEKRMKKAVQTAVERMRE